MAGDANTHSYMNVRVQLQNLNAKVLHPLAVALFDLSIESSVNKRNKIAQHFNGKIL
jgi:hypothetical protein